MLKAVPDIYSQIKPLIKALKVALVSVFCVNRENIETSNSQDISVLEGNVDIGPNNVDNLLSFSYAAFKDTFTMSGLSIFKLVYYLFVFSVFKKNLNCINCFHPHTPPWDL